MVIASEAKPWLENEELTLKITVSGVSNATKVAQDQSGWRSMRQTGKLQ
jgi:purine nucleoside permease